MEYDNVSFLEYQARKKEMLNNIGRRIGKCNRADCKLCPLSSNNNGVGKTCEYLEILNPEIALKIVMEYVPKVDWSTVEVDTKIYVSEDNINWFPRHFSKYEESNVYAFGMGCTSFTAKDKTADIIKWKYAKLALA